jgi:hypothetical protein
MVITKVPTPMLSGSRNKTSKGFDGQRGFIANDREGAILRVADDSPEAGKVPPPRLRVMRQTRREMDLYYIEGLTGICRCVDFNCVAAAAQHE